MCSLALEIDIVETACALLTSICMHRKINLNKKNWEFFVVKIRFFLHLLKSINYFCYPIHNHLLFCVASLISNISCHDTQVKVWQLLAYGFLFYTPTRISKFFSHLMSASVKILFSSKTNNKRTNYH